MTNVCLKLECPKIAELILSNLDKNDLNSEDILKWLFLKMYLQC